MLQDFDHRNQAGIVCYETDDKPPKYATEWERVLWDAYNYKMPSEDCDTKRSTLCSISTRKGK